MKTRAMIIFTAIMLSTLSSGAYAADWSMQGNDAGHTSYTTDVVEPPLKVSWIFDLGFRSPGFTPAEPVVSNNIIYTRGITVDDQNVQEWLFALNASSGKLLWKYKMNSDIRSIAALGDVVVVSAGTNIYALSNGTEKWRREIGFCDQPQISCDQSLIIYKNLVLSGLAFALSLENGSLVWTYEPQLPEANETYWVSNYVHPLAAGEDKVILAIDHTYSTGRPRVLTAIEPGENIEGPRHQNSSATIFALDAKTGKEEWVKRVPFSLESAPVISNGKLFISSFLNATNGSVQAYHLEDGREIWRTAYPGFRKVEAVKDNFLFQ